MKRWRLTVEMTGEDPDFVAEVPWMLVNGVYETKTSWLRLDCYEVVPSEGPYVPCIDKKTRVLPPP